MKNKTKINEKKKLRDVMFMESFKEIPNVIMRNKLLAFAKVWSKF